MASDRALYWVFVVGLIAMTLAAGLPMAAAVAACVGAYLACDQIIFGGKVTTL